MKLAAMAGRSLFAGEKQRAALGEVLLYGTVRDRVRTVGISVQSAGCPAQELELWCWNSGPVEPTRKLASAWLRKCRNDTRWSMCCSRSSRKLCE